jgi:hypothetical protein
MTPENFCYWLNGFIEINQPEEITEKQLQIIKDHLKLVMEKKTPHRDIGYVTTSTSFPNPSIIC